MWTKIWALRRPLKTFFTAPRFLLVILIFLIAQASSLVGHYLEDLLDSLLNRIPLWVKIVLFIAVAVVLAIRVSKIRKRNGNLFYTKFIDAPDRDIHKEWIEKVKYRHPNFTEIREYNDIKTHMSAEKIPVLDVTDSLKELKNSFGLALQTSNPDNGQVLAPNVFWPAGILLGFNLSLTNDFVLEESPNPGRDSLELNLGNCRNHTTCVTEIHQVINQNGKKTAITVALSNASNSIIRSMKTNHDQFPQGILTECDVKDYYIIKESFNSSSNLTSQQLESLIDSLAKRISEIRQEHCDDELIISAAMPKIASIALGYSLRNYPCRFFHKTHFLHYDTAERKYYTMRVHESQPNYSVI